MQPPKANSRLSQFDRWLTAAFWLLLALPGLYQLGLLASAVGRRFGYGYDLEWMEGGNLTHAWRVANGLSLYHPPSVEFIPYLYTPGYPALVAGLGSIFGVSYQTARAVSNLAILGCLVIVGAVAYRAMKAAQESEHDGLWWPVAVAGALGGAGIYASGYPWMEGWYDIGRADSLLIVMVAASALGLLVWGPKSRESQTLGGWFDWRIVGCAAVLALGFFVKQTGVMFVAAAGAAILVINWRMVPAYVVTAGTIGLGGTFIYDKLTDGWFWTYIYEYHQRHTNESERFWGAFDKFWSEFPTAIVVVGVALVAVGVFAAVRRRLPRSGAQFLFWAWFFTVAVVVGAVGLTTQWSYLNAFVPALVFGAIATAAAVVVLAEIGREIGPRSQTVLVFATLAALAMHSWGARWKVDDFVPTEAHEAAGDRMVEMLREAEGPVFVPYSPWYAHLAGKPLYTHKMSINDVTNLTPRHCPPPEKQKEGKECVNLPEGAMHVRGLAKGFQEKKWDVVILKAHNPSEFNLLGRNYRPSSRVGDDLMPPLPTAHQPRGLRVWRPIRPMEPPKNARVVFDFESPRMSGWTLRGRAWGRGPARGKIGGQLPVGGYGGERLMNSYHGGDKSTGTAVSPLFEVDGNELVLHVGGGRNKQVRVELRDASGKVLFTARGKNTEILREVRWDVSKLVGQKVRLALVDEATGGWGHLLVDEVWMVR